MKRNCLLLYRFALALLLFGLPACNGSNDDDDTANDDDDTVDCPGGVCPDDDDDDTDDPPPPPVYDTAPVYAPATGCYAVYFTDSGDVLASTGDGFALDAVAPEDGARFRFQPADLGVYLLYDAEERYLTSDGDALRRQAELATDYTVQEDGSVTYEEDFVSEGEWNLVTIEGLPGMRLQHRRSGLYLDDFAGLDIQAESAELELIEQVDCAQFPELTVNAAGTIAQTTFEDGDVYGFADLHEHMFSNIAFGGGGSFHGNVFHRLGVKHALGDCTVNHGEAGRRDVLGFAFNTRGAVDIVDLVPSLIDGVLPEDDHATDGYPTFTDWPAAPFMPTHQMQYYKWIERAWLAGMRLVVQHATTNQVLCEMVTGVGSQYARHSCNDMVNVDMIIERTYALERYVDALHGGPGKGWFRIVLSPEEAREVIEDGKLAVVLGIETSDLFDCYAVPFREFDYCTEEDVLANLDEYHEKGVRIIFPVHKFDNGFSAGDGHRGIITLGNIMHTGYYPNFVPCDEDLDFPKGFDGGSVQLGNLNNPRDDYFAEPPFDMSTFALDPVSAILYNTPELVGALLNVTRLEGSYCQNHGLTELGEFLMMELMKRGMIPDMAHLPAKSYKRGYELLVENDYPALDTHGRDMNGTLFDLGGMSNNGFGRCGRADQPGTLDNGFQNRLQKMRDRGDYVAAGFGFDLNGLAGAPKPRFGERSGCNREQFDQGITYPFMSYAGDIELQQPYVGERMLDFNTEGMSHIGLVAEYIQDVRLDGSSDEDLEPLFRSAEKFLRLWARAESRGAEIRGE